MIAELVSALVPGLGLPLRNAVLENPGVGLSDPNAFGDSDGAASEAGIRLSHKKALGLAAVWQAVSMISGDLASLTLNVYRRLIDDDREIDRAHPAQRLVNQQANEEMGSWEFWRRLMVHALLWQNGYAYIDRRGGRYGEPAGLMNLLPDRTRSQRDRRTGELYYVTEVDGRLEPLFREEVLHVKGLSLDNGIGYDLLAAARNSWGLALAAEGFSSKFFANGAQAGGVLEIPASFKEGAARTLEEGFRRKYEGKDNWFKTIVLRDGAKFHAVTIDPQKSQMHELREDQVREVARYFNLPPFKLGLADSVSYNSAEMGQLVYLTSCLNHWRMAIAGECDLKLLDEKQRRAMSHYFEHNLTNLVEIDVKTMNEVLEIQRRNEIINANDWRRKINLPRRQDAGGEEYRNPNTKSDSAPTASAAGGDLDDAAGSGQRDRVTQALRHLLAETVNRVARRVCFDARAAAKKPTRFLAWLDSKGQDHRDVCSNALRPVLETIAAVQGVGLASLLCSLEGRFFADLLSRLSPLVDPPYRQEDLERNVSERCAAFEASIAGELIGLVFTNGGDV